MPALTSTRHKCPDDSAIDNDLVIKVKNTEPQSKRFCKQYLAEPMMQLEDINTAMLHILSKRYHNLITLKKSQNKILNRHKETSQQVSKIAPHRKKGIYESVSKLPHQLPPPIPHLTRVAECPDCKMPATNLAKVFGPTIVGYSVAEPEPVTMLTETKLQQLVMEGLLNISSDYWTTFINIQDENLYPKSQHTPDLAVGARRSSHTGRRRSFLQRTPLASK
ncbi:unnamed protein product, partial [Meganyctiphanes norvegica]